MLQVLVVLASHRHYRTVSCSDPSTTPLGWCACSFDEVSECEIDHGKKAFAQRDFIFLLRSQRRQHERECARRHVQQPFDLTFPILIQPLRRNFNGISSQQFKRVVQAFISRCDVAVPRLWTAEQVRSPRRQMLVIAEPYACQHERVCTCLTL